jgi:hypothetical protein
MVLKWVKGVKGVKKKKKKKKRVKKRASVWGKGCQEIEIFKYTYMYNTYTYNTYVYRHSYMYEP